MTHKMTQNGRKLVLKITISQLITSSLIGIGFAIFSSWDDTLSFALGSLSAIIPTLVMGLFTFKYAGGNKNELVLKSFNAGNKIKFLLTLVILAVSIQQPFMQFYALLIGYIAATVAQWWTIFHWHKIQ